MIKFHEIIKLLENFCPQYKAEQNDVVGKQISVRKNKNIKKILIALDCNYSVIEKAVVNQVDLIITHHPLLWPTRRKAYQSPEIFNKITKLKKAKIAVYTMHTNYDEMYLKKDLLKFVFSESSINEDEPLIAIGKIQKSLTLENILKKLKTKFQISNCLYYGDLKQKVQKVALAPGAGGFSLKVLKNKKIDLIITGELKWSDWIKVQENDQAVIVLGHQMEEIFTQKMPIYLMKLLQKINTKIDIETMFHDKILKYY